jgi:hypothetical protein
MKRSTLTLLRSAIFGQHSATVDERIEVALPHGRMELHPTGNVLSREEYSRLTRAVGLVEARAVASSHRLTVGTVPVWSSGGQA